jgi:hypothetical protein
MTGLRVTFVENEFYMDGEEMDISELEEGMYDVIFRGRKET